MKKFLLSISLAMACALTAYADKASDYKEYATRVRAEVWADSLPQFSAPPQVPDKYKNESAVILAAHKNISAKKKTGIGFDATQTSSIDKHGRLYAYIDTDKRQGRA